MKPLTLIAFFIPLISFAQKLGEPIDSLLGKKFILGHTIEKDFNTQKEISDKYGEVWEVYYLFGPTAPNFNYTVLSKNSRGNSVLLNEIYFVNGACFRHYNSFFKKEKKFGIKVWKDLLEGKVWIGMNEEMARESWGEPYRINKTTNSYSLEEQWVYDSGFLYFTNGKLTTIQN